MPHLVFASTAAIANLQHSMHNIHVYNHVCLWY